MKMKNFVLLIAVPFLVGCASTHMPTGYLSHPEARARGGMNKVWTDDDTQLSSYSNILVNRFSTENAAGKHPDINERAKSALLRTELIAELKRNGKNATEDKLNLPSGAPYLVVDGVFAQLSPGSRALRYWIGFGAGRSLVEVEVKVHDNDRPACAEFSVGKSKFIGAWGGSSDKFIDDGIRDIAKLVTRAICSN